MIWIPIVIAILLLLYLLTGFICVFILYHPKKTSKEKAHQYDLDKGLIPTDLSFLERKEVVIPISDGSKIHGDISIPKDPKGLVICCHGYTWNREGQLKYALMFYEKGYAIFIYDHRGHGKNQSKFTTIGYKEAKDLAEIIAYWRKEFPKDFPIILQGESMGSATVIGTLKYRQDISLVVADCGFASFKELLLHIMKQYKVPLFLLPSIRLWAALILHFDILKFKPIDALKDNEVPLLFVHGKEDNFVPTENAYQFDQACHSKHRLVIVEKANHAESFETNPEQYKKEVHSFMKELSLL